MLGQNNPPCATIVGIAENTIRGRLIEEPRMHVYLPFGQEVGFGGAALLVRGMAAPQSYADAIKRELIAADPTITFVNTDTIQDRIDPQMRSWQLGTATLAFSGLLALIVAAVGIYSVLAYLVADRRHEMGVRIALGAGIEHVTGMVLRWSLKMASIGIVIGWAIAAATAGFVQPMLFRVSARDPMVFASVAVILLSVAVLASLAPALRAARVDPIEALRTE
jgi:ABC-type lipoprotein release transport system permease subunit